MNAVDRLLLVDPSSTIVASHSAALPARLAATVTIIGSGNRCGHDPRAPRWFEPPPHHAAHPRILTKLQAAVRAYFADPRVLPSLNAANGSLRQQRSERREACLDLLGALIHYLDLVTLRVGIPHDDDTFSGLTLDFLAEKAGLGVRRAERACRDLYRAGLVNIYPIAQRQEDGRYRGLPAIRSVPTALFKVFGLDQWLPREREKAFRRRRRQQRRHQAAVTGADQGRQELNREAVLRQVAAAHRQPDAIDPAADAEADVERKAAKRAVAQAHLGPLLRQLRGNIGPP